ncbi:mitochondrial carrier, partial [Hymenopellis radicata]
LHLVSGALSGLASTVCLQPFDLVKTRVQQVDHGHAVARVGILPTTRDILSTQGAKGLWRGTNASLIRNVPGVALYMAGLTHLRTILAASPYFTLPLPRLPGELSAQGNLLAGATARVTVGFVLNPFSVLKARFESNMYAYPSLFQALRGMKRAELFRGFLASSLRDAPYAGLFVVFYESIKRDLPSTWNSTIIHSTSAASAGALATIATHPFDVIKTKIQVRPEDRYQGFTRTVMTIWNQRGIQGYFDGVSLRLSRKVLSSAIAWAVYEGVLMFMRPL